MLNETLLKNFLITSFKYKTYYDAIIQIYNNSLFFKDINMNKLYDYKDVLTEYEINNFNCNNEFDLFIDSVNKSEFLKKVIPLIIGKNISELIDYRNEIKNSFKLIEDISSHIGSFPSTMKILGREQEFIEMSITINRKIKNNLLLIGSPGVGKTSLVQEFAKINNMNILVISAAQLLSGTKYRGDFEEKIIKVFKIVETYKIPVFIDEIHTVIHAGEIEGGISLNNILKPIISNPDVLIIGATTITESHALMKDLAFKRRFVAFELKEMTQKEICKYFDEFATHVIDMTYNISFDISNKIKNYLNDNKSKILNHLDNKFDLHYPDKLIDFLDYTCAFYLSQEKFPNIIEKDA